MGISADTRSTAGLSRGRQETTTLQVTFARAGHGHAGVLLVFALIGLILADSVAIDGKWKVIARNGIWAAAILFPTGFIVASVGQDRTEANRWIVLVYLGAVVLALSVATLGIAPLMYNRANADGQSSAETRARNAVTTSPYRSGSSFHARTWTASVMEWNSTRSGRASLNCSPTSWGTVVSSVP